MRALMAFVIALLFVVPEGVRAQTGKIAGTVKDSRTGEVLVAANVMIEGTTIGAATNLDGEFVILSVPPGTYSVRASMIGYAPTVVRDVRVSIDLTTEIAFLLTETVFQTEEVIVVATRPVVQKDLSGSTANLNIQEIQNLPITQVATVIGLQAGVQGLTIRGSSSDQADFVLNGLSLRDERSNVPYTGGVSLLAVQEIQIQTGGFNAEYGNIRSGLINVVTREGSTNQYHVAAQVRYRPPQRKYFGMAPNHPLSYWIRPFIDDDVAWTGTRDNAAVGYQSPWDPWTRRQYPDFDGWNAVSQRLLADNDPNNDLSPQAAQQVFLWQHRKSFDVKDPDYDVDFGFGGPVPVVSEMLGKLRFFASGRYTKSMYAIPLSRDFTSDFSTSLKITSDVGKGMKLMIEGLIGGNLAVDNQQTGVYGSFSSPASIGAAMNRVSYIDTRLFTSDYWAPNQVERNMIGAKFTHVLSPETFYELRLQRFESNYSTNPGRTRDTSRVFKFGNNYYLDEAPFGFFASPGEYSTNSIEGMRMAIGMSNARDSSLVARYQANFDIVSQVDKYNQVKGGLEFVYTDNRTNYGSVDIVLQSGRSLSVWETTPVRFAAYIQDKLEFEGMIANLGLRYEMSTGGGDWFDYDPYSRVLFGTTSLGMDTLLAKKPVEKVTSLSPRLGVAFPVSENAKLFFNYGHFRSMPAPENLFLVRRDTQSKSVLRLANPNLPLPKTVAYELGFEYNIADMFLMRLAGYYRDISDQSRLVTYRGYDNKPNYSVTTNTSYADTRGFEATLTKNRGEWIQGFINYTYMVTTSGAFGYALQLQNPVEQRDYERTNPQEFRPRPQPYARANIDLFTPQDFGPGFGDLYPLGDIRVNLLGTWSDGGYFTWVGGGSRPGIVDNIKWKDSWGLDVRFSKSIALGGLNLLLFVDISNVLNLKQLTTYGFVTGTDYEDYLKSLHLAEYFDQFNYGNIAGNDQPGDVRKTGIAFQPMVYARTLDEVPSADRHSRPLYYQASDKQYYQWVGGAWQPADQALVDKTLEAKAYIDMPNQEWFHFLNPRAFYFGMRFSIEL